MCFVELELYTTLSKYSKYLKYAKGKCSKFY